VNPTEIATVVLAVTAALSLLVGLLAWLFRRGASERELATAVRDNSTATRELSSRLDQFMARYEERHEALADRVNEHGGRIVVAEERIRANTTDIARLWPSPGVTKPTGDPTTER
jgi:hypothetical protein